MALLLLSLAAASAVTQQPALPLPLDRLLAEAKQAQSDSRFAEAALLYSRATRLEPRIAELWANRGLMEHLAGQPETALESFAHALRLKPTLFTPLLFSAEDEIILKHPDLALPLLNRATKLQPNSVDAAITRGKAYMALDDPAQAAAAYQTATESGPGRPAAWYGLAVASLAQIESDGHTLALHHAGSPWAGVLYAEELLAQGRLSEGTKLFREALAKADSVTRCKFHQELQISEANQLSNLDLETQSVLNQATSSEDNSCASGEAVSGCARLYLQPANTSVDAANCSRKAAGPEDLFWSIKSNERRAVLALTRFEELSPQSPATFDLTGDLYRRQDLPQRARAEYARALALDPHDPAALLGTAAAFLSESRPEEAVTFAKRGLADHPDDSKLNLAVAEALISRHLYDEAEPYVRSSLRVGEESSPFAHGLLGRIAASRDDTQTAIRELRLGLPADRDGSLHYQLSRALRKIGDVKGANTAESEARALVTRRLSAAPTALQNSRETNLN